VVAALVIVHAGAAAAPCCITPTGLVLFVGLSVLTYVFGITVGFHRHLSHRSFKTGVAIEAALALLGTLALEGGPILWVALHRLHHKEADREGDPHTPRAGVFWAHVLWFSYKHPRLEDAGVRLRYVPDLARRPALVWIEQHNFRLNAASGLGLVAVGWAAGGWPEAVSALLWGGPVRIAFVWHVTFLVNSAAHLWGYRNFATRDDSRNNWWVALLSWGEGWHNNHHADPTAADFGVQWYEFDPGYWTICALERVGLAHSVTTRRKGLIGRDTAIDSDETH
jgi:stearoyl-CoA desaturase (delta-9 desaturase)